MQPGDFFDSFRTPDYVKAWVIDLLNKYKDIPVLFVWGQHDQRFHSRDVRNTPLGVLQATGLCFPLSNEPFSFSNIDIYGSSWEEPIPTIKEKDKVKFNILVMHRMVIHSEKLWEGQIDYVKGENFLKKWNYDLVVSGDNHQSFCCEFLHQKLINCGSLMRTSITQ